MCGKLDCEQSWPLKSWMHCDYSQHRKVKGVVNLDQAFRHVLLSKNKIKNPFGDCVQLDFWNCCSCQKNNPVWSCSGEGIRVYLSAAFPQTNVGWQNHTCIKNALFFTFSSIMLVLTLRKLAGEITHTAGMNKQRSGTVLSSWESKDTDNLNTS